MVMARKKQEKEKDIIDQLLDNIDFRGLTQDEVVGQGGIIKQLTGRILQRALDAEMTEHLGYEKNSNAGDNSGNSRNGHTEKPAVAAGVYQMVNGFVGHCLGQLIAQAQFL